MDRRYRGVGGDERVVGHVWVHACSKLVTVLVVDAVVGGAVVAFLVTR